MLTKYVFWVKYTRNFHSVLLMIYLSTREDKQDLLIIKVKISDTFIDRERETKELNSVCLEWVFSLFVA